MGWREFFASVIGDLLSWPVVLFVLALILIDPLRRLLERLKTAKGFGGEVEFVETIKNVETSTDRAIDDSSASRGAEPPISDTATTPENLDAPTDTPRDPNGARLTEQSRIASDPSGAILQAWQSLVEKLSDLGRINAGRGRPATNPTTIIERARKTNQLSSSFFEAVESLREARNQVAHGEVEPTEGVAHTYVERARQLEGIVEGTSKVASMDLDNPLL
ncbi:hypothetical protein I8D64_11610 [Brachybacterium sp. MASK1Z-5]|uniref:DUF4145 domain-containing protein n=1 Tax=Brachybacterium halotolerans TaxID=2795215 RepID=A0ABS1BBM4_9MICO|nr:hypothetical protein [Brachybacterium halotolerans]MBK0332045.1 hypothetical protein [Brachybacterium halotolerans]